MHILRDNESTVLTYSVSQLVT